MTPTTNTEGAVTDVAAIARKRAAVLSVLLDEAQRALILRLSSRWSRTTGAGKGLYKAATLKALVEIEWTSKEGRYRQRAKLTPLGLAVRNHLTEQGVTAS